MKRIIYIIVLIFCLHFNVYAMEEKSFLDRASIFIKFGTLDTGWREIKGEKFYFIESDKIAKEWKSIDGNWYYFLKSGAMAKGWNKINNSVFYFGEDGKMRTSLQEIEGAKYYFNDFGMMMTGWQNYDGNILYFNKDGKLASGWTQIDGNMLYIDENSKKLVGWQKIGDEWWYFDKNGIAIGKNSVSTIESGEDFFRYYNSNSRNSISQDEKTELIENLPDDLREKIENYPETENSIIKYFDSDNNDVIDISEEVKIAKIDPKRKNMPYFSQWDTRWAFEVIAGEYMATNACGPTVLSSIYIAYTGDTDMDPIEMTKYALRNGWYFSSGSSLALMSNGAVGLGLESTQISVDEDSILQSLDEGKVVVLLVTPGDFTNYGHFIVLQSYDSKGVYIYDPNSYNNSNKIWDLKRIIEQTSAAWEIYK